MLADNLPSAAQRAAQQAAWDHLWRLLLSPPAPPDHAEPTPAEREGQNAPR